MRTQILYWEHKELQILYGENTARTENYMYTYEMRTPNWIEISNNASTSPRYEKINYRIRTEP